MGIAPTKYASDPMSMVKKIIISPFNGIVGLIIPCFSVKFERFFVSVLIIARINILKKGYFMQKRWLIFVIMMYHNYFYSMESMISYIYMGTKINLKKGFYNNCDKKINCIVFGKNEQQYVENNFADQWLVGCTDLSDKKIYMNGYKKYVEKQAIGVIEPLLFINPKSKQYYYYAEKKNEECIYGIKHFGELAKEAALRDLRLCYENVLERGIKEKRKKQRIALPSLARMGKFSYLDFAAVTVGTILDFIKNNPNGYSLIELFIETSIELELYKALIKDY